MVFQGAFDCIDVEYDTGILEFVHIYGTDMVRDSRHTLL